MAIEKVLMASAAMAGEIQRKLMTAAIEAGRAELLRQSEEGEFFYRDEDGMVDGRLDLAALFRAMLAGYAEAAQ